MSWNAYDENGGNDVDLEETNLGIAQGIYLAWHERLTQVTGDREAISRIREEMRVNEEFLESADTIVELVEGQMDWVSSLMRAEAKRAQRTGAEHLERLRQERLAKLEAEKKAEEEALSSMPTFGMF